MRFLQLIETAKMSIELIFYEAVKVGTKGFFPVTALLSRFSRPAGH